MPSQGTFAVEHDGEHGDVDLRRAGVRLGEGRAQHHVLHTAPDPLLGHHHHDQHRWKYPINSAEHGGTIQCNAWGVVLGFKLT